uniref:Uncharacterized protein LOC111101843 n=1 Tax=Crassostrea virginica TaxID=6565 RepID=A0A8B8AJG4_CRAVI|nr:uncharacterized protein LOC111101843 [Crassostrea virginica]
MFSRGKAKIGLEKCGELPIKRRRSPMALAEWWCKTGLDRNELESKFIGKEIALGAHGKQDLPSNEDISSISQSDDFYYPSQNLESDSDSIANEEESEYQPESEEDSSVEEEESDYQMSQKICQGS